MYSKNARWQTVVEIAAPRKMLIEIAERHKQWHHLQQVDYYYTSELGLRAVTEELTHGWHKDVNDWRWDNMERIL